MKKKVFFIVSITAVLLIAFWLTIGRMVYRFYKTPDPVVYSKTIPDEYREVLKDPVSKYTYSVVNRQYPGRFPAVVINYQDSFGIVINKWKLAVKEPLQKVIHTQKREIKATSGETYGVLYINRLFFDFLYAPSTPVTDLWLRFDEDGDVRINSADTVCVILPQGFFSISVAGDSLVDLLLRDKSSIFQKVPVQQRVLFFLKKGDDLYFLFVISLQKNYQATVRDVIGVLRQSK